MGLVKDLQRKGGRNNTEESVSVHSGNGLSRSKTHDAEAGRNPGNKAKVNFLLIYRPSGLRYIEAWTDFWNTVPLPAQA